ncbi:MAG TPA: hypothetical protein VG477_04735 [Thermoanaerobaculia bacterium]|nr:hypothetical protein [Thermoanaerobaculia bacterium]
MSSKARRTAATLIAAAFIACSAAPPAHAAPGRASRHADDVASWTTSERGLMARLFRWIAKAGGAMDPNGNH